MDLIFAVAALAKNLENVMKAIPNANSLCRSSENIPAFVLPMLGYEVRNEQHCKFTGNSADRAINI